MEFEICFLNRRGDLSCSMRAAFNGADHAARYARDVMETGSGRSLRAAEIFKNGKVCARVDFVRTLTARPQIFRTDTVGHVIV